MNSSKAVDLINEHFGGGNNIEEETLVEASQTLIEEYGSATNAAKQTEASTHSLQFWNRIGSLSEAIQGYVFMGELAATKADIIRRVDSERAQHQIALVTIEEDLSQEYVRNIVTEVQEADRDATDVIEEMIGDIRKLHTATIGFEEDLNLQIWVEAGRRRTSKAELCQELVKERMQEISEDTFDFSDEIEQIRRTTDTLEEEIEELNELASLLEEVQRERTS